MQFKKIPGNELYEISLKGVVRKISTGRVYQFPKNTDDTIQMTLFKQKRNVCLEWLGLMAHFEIYPPKGYSHRFWNVEFENEFKWTNWASGKLPVLRSPIVLPGGFKWLPKYPKYAISKSGVLLDIDRDIIKHPTKPLSKKHYSTFRIYDPQYGGAIDVRTHRLIAYAWVKNSDYVLNMVVNHINGNKHDHRSINLEWCSHADNSNHAYRAGLRFDNKPCKVNDYKTGTITVYHSLGEANRQLGLKGSAGLSLGFMRETKLIGDRWAVKDLNDTSPWPAIDFKNPPKHGRYRITLRFSDGTVDVFYSVRDIIHKYRVWNVQSVVDVTNKLKRMIPGTEVEILDQFNTGPYQARSYKTGRVYEGESSADLANTLNMHKAFVVRGVKMPSGVISGYQFRKKSNEPWVEPKPSATLAKKIIAKHPENNCLTFESLRKASDHFNVDKSVISLRMKNGRDLNGWTFKSE